ncbi:MAG: ribonuclease Z [bacterium]|nr:ribonuclease Z [bacterium]
MNRVTVIGSGNAFNTDGRAHACYLVESDGGSNSDETTSVLLDCGATSLYRLQQEGVDLNGIDAVLLTHFHGDHFAGLPFILLEMSLVCGRKRPLHIFGPPGVAAACQAIVDLCYPGFRFAFDIEYAVLDARSPENAQTQQHGRPQSFQNFTIIPYPIEHRPESTGYRLVAKGAANSDGGSFAFSGDALFDQQLIALVDGVDLALVELTMQEQWDPPVAHLALDEVRARGRELKAKRLVYTHITDDLARQVVAEGLGEVASDGLTLNF